MTRAECVRECIWQNRHWKAGEIYEGAETPPRHFRTEKPAAALPQPPEPMGESGAETEVEAGMPEVAEVPEPQKKSKPRKSRKGEEGE